jgi:hypothetical protein
MLLKHVLINLDIALNHLIATEIGSLGISGGTTRCSGVG